MFFSRTHLCASSAIKILLQTAALGPLEKQKKNKRKTQKQLSVLSAEIILSFSLDFAYALACLIKRNTNQCEGTPLSATLDFFFFLFFDTRLFREDCENFGCVISWVQGADSAATGLFHLLVTTAVTFNAHDQQTFE